MVFTNFHHKRVLVFPGVLVLILLTLTVARISGTSLGVFNTFLYPEGESPDTVLFEARGVRSDEWEVNTPLTIAQVKSGMPVVNENIGNGQDMAVVLDVPYKDWSTLFKPQNLSFFLLPLEHAFAFKWWFIACILMIGCYLFCLKLLPSKHLLASLISLSIFFSPFVQWWYQTATIMPIGLGFLLMYLSMLLFERGQSKSRKLMLAGFLSYTLVCFAFVLYAPFVLPVAVCVAAFLAGHVCNLYRKKSQRESLRLGLLWSAGALLVSLFIAAFFLWQHSETVHIISNTVYPGNRVEQSGGYGVTRLVSGYFNMQLQDLHKALNIPSGLNQSEAASFILTLTITVPLLVLFSLKDYVQSKKIDWRFALLMAVLVLFAVRMFVPFSEFFFNAIQLNRIPHNRLLIAVGFINVLLLVLLFERLLKQPDIIPRGVRYIVATFAFVVPFATGIAIKTSSTGYLESSAKVLLVGLTFGAIAWLIMRRQLSAAMIVLVLFSVYSSVRINPLQQGLSPVINSPLSSMLQNVDDKDGRWVVSEDVIFENVTLANDLSSLSGVYAYPQLDLWKPLATTNTDEDIYNRYAHVFFSTQPVSSERSAVGAYLNPPALDAFQVNADPCGTYFKQMQVKYILTSHKKDFGCLEQINAVAYPKLTLRVYKVNL